MTEVQSKEIVCAVKETNMLNVPQETVTASIQLQVKDFMQFWNIHYF